MRALWLIIALLSMGLYQPLNHRHVRYYWKTRYDKRIPFLPGFVVAYLGLFPFMLIAFVTLFSTAYAVPFFASVTFASLTAALSWFFFPTGAHRPHHMRKTFFRDVLRGLYNRDEDGNAFPSAHVFLAGISGWYLAAAFPPFALVIWLSALLIAVSTVLVRQHNVVDILGGAAWAIAAIYVGIFIL